MVTFSSVLLDSILVFGVLWVSYVMFAYAKRSSEWRVSIMTVILSVAVAIAIHIMVQLGVSYTRMETISRTEANRQEAVRTKKFESADLAVECATELLKCQRERHEFELSLLQNKLEKALDIKNNTRVIFLPGGKVK